MDFTGLSAFPPTPLTVDGADERAFRRIVGRLSAAGVDSIAPLGSTGHYAYLSLPESARLVAAAVTQAASAGDAERARGISQSLEPLWSLFRDHGSARVVAAVARELGLADSDFLPRPLRPLDEMARWRLRGVLDGIGV